MIGRYRVVRRIGAGGMGVVYEASDDELKRRVALKVLRSGLADTPEGRGRLVREAQAMARLSHPNVVHVYEIGQHSVADPDGGEATVKVFIAMELIRGETLRRWAADPERRWTEVLQVYLRAGRGLAAAHGAGVVHRDFKPDNVLVDDDGVPHVLDFGLARHDTDVSLRREIEVARTAGETVDTDEVTLTGTVLGTPAYMPPEQLEGGRSDHRADQFAFCVSLYEALWGSRPFLGSTPEELATAIRASKPTPPRKPRFPLPRRVRRILARGFAADPDDRHASMNALIDALDPFAGGPRWGRRLAWGVGLAAAVGAGAAAATRPEAGGPVAAQPADPWAAIVAVSDLPPVQERPLPDDPTGVTVHRLRNGLTVYVAPRPGEPRVEALIVVRAGPDVEAPDQTGIAWLLRKTLADSYRIGSKDPAAERPLLERMHAALIALETERDPSARAQLLKTAADALGTATPYQVVGEDERLRTELGFGVEKAFEGPRRRSVYHASVPRNRLDAWAQLYAEPLRRPSFRLFSWALADVFRSSRSHAGDAARHALERELGTLSGHPFDAESTAEVMARIPFAAMVRFWEAYYRPNNTAVVLVGDISADDALTVVERWFGDWRPAPSPAPPPSAAPVPDQRAVNTVVDDGPPGVLVGWPLPQDKPTLTAVLALRDLLQRSSLAAQWFEGDGRARAEVLNNYAGYFEISVEPAADRTLAQAQAAVFEFLSSIADDAIAPEPWAAAQGAAELAALRWADAPDELAFAIAESFTQRLSWAQAAQRLRGGPVDSRAARRGASALLQGPAAIVHHVSGPPTTVELPLPPWHVSDKEEPYAEFPSPFARALLAQPQTALEPQFLVEGRDFQIAPRGAGRVITVELSSPLFHLEWVWGAGVAEDALMCDAWRALISAAAPATDAAGLDLRADCGLHETTIAVQGVAERFEAAWPALRAVLEDRVPDDAAIAQHVDRTLGRRAFVRTDPYRRTEALHLLALHGEHSVDAHMLADAALGRARPDAFRSALAVARQTDPDILFAGPAAERVAPRLPPRPPARARPPWLRRSRGLERTTLFVVDDPDRRGVDVRRVVALPTPDTRSILLGDLLRHTDLPMVEVEGYGPASSFAQLFAAVPGAYGIVRQDAVACSHRSVAATVRGLRGAHNFDPKPADWKRARSSLEARYRSTRRSGLDRARVVRHWLALGLRTDPAVDNWVALGAVSDEDLAASHRRLVEAPAVVTIVADLEYVDMAALASIGEVVEVQIDQVRDVDTTDFWIYGLSLED